MNFNSFVQKERAAFEDYLKGTIQLKSETQLEEAMLYSIEAGGKRLRPLLLLSVLEAFQKEAKLGYETAAALEMIHTYSLIHDDLPAMDNDHLRRGKPTNHIKFSEATAILAGDALLTYAFQVVTEGDFSGDKKVQIIRLLSECSGYNGMVGGQQADINGENRSLSLEELEHIHQRKTGELIRFALVAGGILADQPENILKKLEEIARLLGIAYQIRDDILDVIGTEEELGKAVHADEKLGKSTYPALLGLENAKEKLEEGLNRVKQALRDIEQEVERFDQELLNTFVDQLYLEELE